MVPHPQLLQSAPKPPPRPVSLFTRICQQLRSTRAIPVVAAQSLCAAVLLMAMPIAVALAVMHSCLGGRLASVLLHCDLVLPQHSMQWGAPPSQSPSWVALVAWHVWQAGATVLVHIASVGDRLRHAPTGTLRGHACAWMVDNCVDVPWARQQCARLLAGWAVAVITATVGRTWYGSVESSPLCHHKCVIPRLAGVAAQRARDEVLCARIRCASFARVPYIHNITSVQHRRLLTRVYGESEPVIEDAAAVRAAVARLERGLGVKVGERSNLESCLQELEKVVGDQ